MRFLPLLLAILGSWGCSASVSTSEAPVASQPTDSASAGGEQTETSPTVASHAGETPPQPTTAAIEPLPESLDAGTIARGTLNSVLAQGVAAFLQKVSVQPHRPAGRFEGWLLHSVFAGQPDWQQSCVLRPGDVVLRVNNQSVERPEQFMAVWQSLSSAGEIAIDVVRDGHGSRVRYVIVD